MRKGFGRVSPRFGELLEEVWRPTAVCTLMYA
jgi:hypothetical protein